MYFKVSIIMLLDIPNHGVSWLQLYTVGGLDYHIYHIDSCSIVGGL